MSGCFFVCTCPLTLILQANSVVENIQINTMKINLDYLDLDNNSLKRE